MAVGQGANSQGLWPGRTRAAIRGFIKYLLAYERGQRKKGNPER